MINAKLDKSNTFVRKMVREFVNQEEDKKMKKAMLSQPMAGKSDEEIKATRERAIKALEEIGRAHV